MPSKIAQTSQVFIYILSIIIIATILLFGYRAIANFGNKAEQVSYVKFKTDLESTVASIGPDYGSITRQEFVIGSNYQQICFVSSKVVDGTIYDENPDYVFDSDSKSHPLIKDMVESGVNKNTFLMSTSLEESFDVGKIKVDSEDVDDFVCIPSLRGRIKLEFEGLGDRTKISEWSLS